ncbi:MAG: glycine cleavage system protein R [Deltaproteobacteria bacterium]|nr:glycine cleavage system protein R [Deltaproteobacteria bacterium]
MQKTLVLNVIGRDRPGLVDALATAIATHGGSWCGSRMARLAGQFAGIVEVEVDGGREAELREELAGLAGRGLAVSVVDAASPEGEAAETRLVTVEVVGSDRPGIVKGVSRALAESGANVVDLETTRGGAAMTGVPMFEARAVVQLPAAVAMADVRGRLEALAADLMVELTVGEGA